MNVNKFGMLTRIACSAVFTVATAATSMAQPLINGGFESDAVGTLTTGWSINNGGTTSANYAQSGSKSLLIDSTGVGQWWSPNVYQTFSASAGQEFNLSGYMLAPTAIVGGSFGLFKIEFRDAASAILQPASVSIGGNAAGPYYGAESTPFLNGASPVGQWVFSEAQGVAPANTATVWFYALNVNDLPNSMYFDTISASVVPEPSTLAVAGLALASLVSFRRRK